MEKDPIRGIVDHVDTGFCGEAFDGRAGALAFSSMSTVDWG